MRVVQMQLLSTARPILNNTYINTGNPAHRNFSMEMDARGEKILATHQERGVFVVPITSCSWWVLAPRPARTKAPAKSSARRTKAPAKEKAKVEATA